MKPKPTTCATCGASFPVPPPNGGAAGYATTRAGKRICYDCADASQRADFAKLDRFCAYLSSDGKSITTWTGGKLADVTYAKPCRLTRQSYLHGKDFRTIWATNPHTGNVWIGRGSPGVCIKIRKID